VDIGILLAVLALIAAFAYRRRHRRAIDTVAPSVLDDDAIRQIERHGWIDVEEPEAPMDLDHIREEEARFWEESWDEPDEY
jgi:hypothetical protein